MAQLIHPLRLLTRTDAQIASVFHSFYLIELKGGSLVNIVRRVPARRNQVDDDIEAGLNFYMSDIVHQPFDRETYGSFVLTSSIGSRFYTFWRAEGEKMFVAVSEYFLSSFTRELFHHLGDCSTQSLNSLLLALCSCPIIPLSEVSYHLALPTSHEPPKMLSINFSNTEQTEDWDVSSILCGLLSPQMLVSAWEAILLERKVLVACTNVELVPPCCEFLRRLVLPLVVVNTYVPLLTRQLINTLDSPLPYLVGAQTDLVLECQIDLSEIVVVDIDARCVYTPKFQYGKEEIGAPPSVISSLMKELSAATVQPLQHWLSRPDISPADNPHVEARSKLTANAITAIFVQTNLRLLTARANTGFVPSFFRRKILVQSDSEEAVKEKHLAVGKEAQASFIARSSNRCTMGFAQCNDTVSGLMQLLRERYSNDSIVQFLPVWVEMDDLQFSVYEHTDETPILSFQVKDIHLISPCSVEPEGHVFELVSSNATHRFAASDAESRRLWIDAVEEKVRVLAIRNEAAGPMSPTLGRRNSREAGTLFTDENPREAAFVTGLGRLNLPQNSNTELEDEQAVSEFRLQIKKTQMYSYLHSQIACEDFETLLRKLKVNADKLAEQTVEQTMEQYLWAGSTVTSQLEKMCTRLTSPTGGSTPASPTSPTSPQSSTVLSPPHVASDCDDSSTQASAAEIDELNSYFGDASEDSNRKKSGSVTSAPVKSRDADVKSAVSSKSIASPVQASKPSNQGLIGMFKGIFRGTKEGSSITEDETTGEQDRLAELEKEVNEERQKRIKKLLQHVSASNRRSEEELHRLVVEHRLAIACDLARSSLSSAKTSRLYFDVELPVTASEPSDPVALDTGSVTAPGHWIDRMWTLCPLQGEEDDLGDAEAPVIAPTNKPSEAERAAESAEIEAIHRHFLQSWQRQMSERLTSNAALSPIYHTLIGSLFERLGESENALASFSVGCFVDQKNIMNCVTKKFVALTAPTETPTLPPPPPDSSTGRSSKMVSVSGDLHAFLQWAQSFGATVGLQAYRLVTELMHKNLSLQLAKLRGIEISQLVLDHSCMLNTQKSSSANVQRPGLMSMISKKKLNSVEGLADKLTRLANLKNETLNEMVPYDECQVEACELSVMLLSRLRELLRSCCESNPEAVRTQEGFLKLKLSPDTFDQLIVASAFRAFEVDVCQLQKVELRGLSTDQRVVFFVNVYNTLHVHAAIIFAHRGGPGSNLYERSVFMRKAKYNIGGLVYDLMDIEHGVLRACSSNPMIFGPFSPSMSFADRDPRKAFALDQPRPKVTFCLYTMCLSSPSLVVLRDPSALEDEFKRCTKLFVQYYVKYLPDKKAVELPEVLRIFWNDFGGTRGPVIAMIRRHHTRQFSEAVKQANPRVNFVTMDWTPTLFL